MGQRGRRSGQRGFRLAAGRGCSVRSEDDRLLLELARRALVVAVAEGRELALPPGLPATLLQPRGVFVTLELDGELRGCIGHIFPREPLALAVVHNARHAALEDPRFPPVSVAELPGIVLEVSVLTEPRPLDFASPDELLRRLRPGVDGVVLEIAGRRATFLPQVWEKLPEPGEFLAQLASKGGFARDAWRAPDVTVLTYGAEKIRAPAPEASGSRPETPPR